MLYTASKKSAAAKSDSAVMKSTWNFKQGSSRFNTKFKLHVDGIKTTLQHLEINCYRLPYSLTYSLLLTFASKLIPCWKASSLCRGIRRSCPSSTKLYFVLAGMLIVWKAHEQAKRKYELNVTVPPKPKTIPQVLVELTPVVHPAASS